MNHKSVSTSLFDKQILGVAFVDSFRKLTPQQQWKNPVMFVVYIGSLLTTLLWVLALDGKGEEPANFILAITLWLWGTVLFANFAEAVAEGRSKAAPSVILRQKNWMSRIMVPIIPKLPAPVYGAVMWF
jgi:K+-transporting ATPase ATPase B chain